MTINHSSLAFLRHITPSEFAPILIVGVSDGNLVDALLAEGYMNTTVVDPCEAAITTAQEQFAEYDILVRWVCADLLHAPLKPNRYALWVDTTLFERLLLDEQRLEYLQFMQSRLRMGGVAVIATACDLPALIQSQVKDGLTFTDCEISPLRDAELSIDPQTQQLWVFKSSTVLV